MFNYRNASAGTDHIYVKTGYEQVKVLFDDILYLEATGNYVTFVLKDKSSILSRSTFVEAINLLPPEKFIRVHRSFVVALNKIDKVDRQQVTINKTEIPVGQAFASNLSDAFKSR